MLISNCLSELEAADFADMVSYVWKALRVETQKSCLISLITSLSVVSLDILMTHLQSEDYYELRRSYCLLGSCLFYKVRAILCVALSICSSLPAGFKICSSTILGLFNSKPCSQGGFV